jgi:alanine-glyoxylate transaminase/serine-glyoxylate transaminase/serine-pyruvate transaminase
MAAPLLGYLDPEFLALLDRVQSDLRQLFHTENRFTLPISGTGSAGMEATMVNLVQPGDRVVVGIHGYFGERLKEMARRHGGDVVEVRTDYGTAIDPEAMADAIDAGATALVAVVHAETSTGVLQPIDEIAKITARAGALLVVDCVTSFCGVPVDLDRWGVDAAYSGSQKCLSVPPGLSPVSFSSRALDRVRARSGPPSSFYLDTGLLDAYWGEERVYHHTVPVSMIYGLAAGLDDVLEEGLSARHDRHRSAAQALYRGLEVLGLKCLVPTSQRTPMLTSVLVPDAVDEKAGRALLRERHRIEIGGGLGPLAGRIWRIGLMGHGARLSAVTRVIAGLADVLADAGVSVDLGASLRAVSRDG